ncbi:MAG: PLP-dependent transferase [Burkholderiaceae bacterium]|nr:PLP-dependent transferase [Burkholderiaceae bacterium]
MSDRNFGIDTLCLHAGQLPDPATGSRAQPIYQTTSYVFDSADHAASLFNLQTFGNVYSRISNPTVAVFEERVAALENGRAALATASGMAAQLTAILAILQPGDHIAPRPMVHHQFAVTLPKMGITATFVDPDDPENFRRALQPNSRLAYGETLGNPKINVLDIERVAAIAHDAQIPLMIDNTMASRWCRPCTGRGTSVAAAGYQQHGRMMTLGGVLVEAGRFDWGNGKFPDMVLPSKGYHGVKFWETFGDFAYTMKARMEVLRVHGSSLAPMSAWLLLQGLETLHVRMDRHVQNARRVAEFLSAHPRVKWVNWPGLASSPYYALAQKYLKPVDGEPGASSVMTFGIDGGNSGGAAAGEK